MSLEDRIGDFVSKARVRQTAQPAATIPSGLKWFLGFFIVVGLIAMGAGVWNLVNSLRCASWPSVSGVIISSEMKSNSSEDGHTYSASIAYAYQLGQTHFEGTRLAFGAMSSSSAYARKILDRFPVGKTVPVYYSPTDPGMTVLEPGIHGGTWICFGVGTVFVLAGLMFLQLFSAGSRARQNAGPDYTVPATDAVRGQGQQPPVLMGVIFIVMGSFVFFGEPSAGVPKWVVCAAGGMFVLAGLFMLARRLQNQMWSKILGGAALFAFMAIFHWVSFGPGERIGTSTTPFATHSGVNVKTAFAAFTVFFDLIFLAIFVNWLVKRRKN